MTQRNATLDLCEQGRVTEYHDEMKVMFQSLALQYTTIIEDLNYA